MDEEPVEEFVDQAQSVLEASPAMDEEATKFRLIVPFIEVLGWDTRSTEVEPEYTVRMATGKTKVDFALLLGDTPVVFIEAKPARSDLDNDNIEQLRSYMRQELEVDWGVVTNGKSFEVLTKGDDSRQEEISLIQFDLDDLRARPELLEILSRESIQSGKSDEIAAQIAQTGEAISHLKENGDNVARQLNTVLVDEIGESVPLDTEVQATEFVDSLISALEEQRSAIGTASTSNMENSDTSSTSEEEGTQTASGNYITKIGNNGNHLITLENESQSGVMEEVVNYLIENHNLISKIEPLPYVPGREKAIINDTPTSPHDEDAMRLYRELSDGYYLDTHANKRGKIRALDRLVDECGLEIEYEGEW